MAPDGPSGSPHFLLLDQAVIMPEKAGQPVVARIAFPGSLYEAARLLWVLIRVCEPLDLVVFDEQLRQVCSRATMAESVNVIGRATQSAPLVPPCQCYLWCERTCGLRLTSLEALATLLPSAPYRQLSDQWANAAEQEILALVVRMQDGCPHCAAQGNSIGPVVSVAWRLDT